MPAESKSRELYIYLSTLDPNKPPINITYDKLVNQFFDDLLLDEAMKLEGDAEKIAKEIEIKIKHEIAKGKSIGIASDTTELIQRIFNTTIENNIEECKEKLLNPKKNKEELRRKLWGIWYKIMVGYVPEYKKIFNEKTTIAEEIILHDTNNKEPIDDGFEAIIKSLDKERALDKSFKATSSRGGKLPRGHMFSPIQHTTTQHAISQHTTAQSNLQALNTNPQQRSIPSILSSVFNNFALRVWNLLQVKLFNPHKAKRDELNEKYQRETDAYYMEIMDQMKQSIKSGPLTKNLANNNNIDSDFDNIDNNSNAIKWALQSLYYRDVLTKEHNNSKNLYEIYIPEMSYPVSNPNIFPLYKPFKLLHIYGMQLPHQFNRGKLLSTMFYLLDTLKIKNFVDLQDCERGTNRVKSKHSSIGAGCNPYDRNGQRLMWEIAKKYISKYGKQKPYDFTYTKYFLIEDFIDMTEGSFLSWHVISQIPDTRKAENATVVHCFAGKGRTGSVLLFIILRDLLSTTAIETRLGLPYFGFKNSTVLIKEFKHYLLSTAEVINDIGRNIDIVAEELFNTKYVWNVLLLLRRINCIFYFLAKSKKVKLFYTYKIPLILNDRNIEEHLFSNYNIDDIFSIPIERYVNWDNWGDQPIIDHANYLDV